MVLNTLCSPLPMPTPACLEPFDDSLLVFGGGMAELEEHRNRLPTGLDHPVTCSVVPLTSHYFSLSEVEVRQA